MRLSTLFTITILSCAAASAESVVSTPGALQSAIQNPDQITELTVEGSVNAADLKYIAENMPSLRLLDLSNATVAAASDVFINGAESFQANLIPSFVFAGSRLSSVILPTAAGLSIGDGAFAGSDLETVAIGNNVTSIGHGAFMGCPRLQEVSVAAPAIGDGAFAACPQLSAVQIGAAATSLGTETFSDCTALATLQGTENISKIGALAFRNCSALESFTPGAGLSAIGPHAFAGTAIKTLDLSATSIATLPEWALASMTDLTSLEAPAVTGLATGAAMGCVALDNASFSPQLSKIGNLALAGDAALSSLDLGSAESLGAYSLSHVSGLTSLTLPASLTSVGDNAMEYATGLQEITANTTAVPETGKNVWLGVDQSNVKLYVSDETADAFSSTEQWKEFDIVYPGLGVEDAAAADSRILATFEGHVLLIRSVGTDLASVALYDTAGHLLAALSPKTDRAIADTSAFSTDIFIVAATTADGASATFKLARN